MTTIILTSVLCQTTHVRFKDKHLKLPMKTRGQLYWKLIAYAFTFTMSIYCQYYIAYGKKNGAKYIKIWQAVLKLAVKL